MEGITLLALAFALSLDSFAVSISCGIKLGGFYLGKFLKIAFTFAVYQAVMPVAGWLLGTFIRHAVGSYGKWIAFGVFLFLGLKTLLDVWKSKRRGDLSPCNCTNGTCLNSLAVATSIDAFLVGITLSFVSISLPICILVIGGVTFLMVLLGCYLGRRATLLLRQSSQIVAGIILLALAAKTVLF